MRIENRELVESMVHDSIRRLTRADLEECLVGVPCASVNTISEALDDPQSHFRKNVIDYSGVPTLASPFRFMSTSK